MKYKILLAEDEPFLGKVIKESLEKNGYEVVLASNGKEAWGLFNEQEFSICILDVMMPYKDGFTLASQIREFSKNIPLMFLTAKSDIKDVAQGYASGGNDYLRKPFSLEELFLRVAELLKRSKEEKSSTDELRIGEYVFYPKRQELIDSSAQTVKLSYKESRLLELLLQNKNQVLERKLALMRLWGDDNFFNTRNMDVYITKLRKKLQEDTSVEIVNVRGFGYKLIC
ncbi:response regulator transcription factor [Flavobacterium beibuense]|uniref:Two component transcriptional regulator, winged helix family n=1 Tax=Flavobacterium beibuense TaxID=657326 RepID=A0A444WBX2_9FLAO|nr:response regulator transcription factor [Flavobacterium beibuense]RYJ43337.1 Two component transcriptional regulator, winged helix family [Flavobacterium beibuense]